MKKQGSITFVALMVILAVAVIYDFRNPIITENSSTTVQDNSTSSTDTTTSTGTSDNSL